MLGETPASHAHTPIRHNGRRTRPADVDANAGVSRDARHPQIPLVARAGPVRLAVRQELKNGRALNGAALIAHVTTWHRREATPPTLHTSHRAPHRPPTGTLSSGVGTEPYLGHRGVGARTAAEGAVAASPGVALMPTVGSPPPRVSRRTGSHSLADSRTPSGMGIHVCCTTTTSNSHSACPTTRGEGAAAAPVSTLVPAAISARVPAPAPAPAPAPVLASVSALALIVGRVRARKDLGAVIVNKNDMPDL